MDMSNLGKGLFKLYALPCAVAFVVGYAVCALI